MQELREEFEVVAKNCMFELTRDKHDDYANMRTHLFWMGYKACAQKHQLY